MAEHKQLVGIAAGGSEPRGDAAGATQRLFTIRRPQRTDRAAWGGFTPVAIVAQAHLNAHILGRAEQAAYWHGVADQAAPMLLDRLG